VYSIDFDIRLDNSAGDTVARWTRGARLKLESTLFDEAREFHHDVLGDVFTLGDAHADPANARVSADFVRAEFDLQPGLDRAAQTPSTDWAVRAMPELLPLVQWTVDSAYPEDVAAFLLGSLLGPVSSQRAQISERLSESGWKSAELWLLTSASPLTVASRVPWCRRGLKILYSSSAAIFAWHPIDKSHDWFPETNAGLVIPLPECHRRHSYLAEIVEDDGAAHVGRMIQDVLQHHEWTRWQVTEHVETWERRFFGAARSGTFFEGIAAEPLGVDLDEVHMLVVELRRVNRDLDRRARLAWLPAPPVTSADRRVDTLRHEIMLRSAVIQENVDKLNGSLREGWTLLAGAATGKHFDLQRQSNLIQARSQSLQQRFQNAATLITSLVLVPGLIVSLYGANVTGLPGYEKRSGLLDLGLYAVVAATTTGACLHLLSVSKRGLAWRVLALGVIVLVILTIAFSR
jgi:hypothetical protein